MAKSFTKKYHFNDVNVGFRRLARNALGISSALDTSGLLPDGGGGDSEDLNNQNRIQVLSLQTTTPNNNALLPRREGKSIMDFSYRRYFSPLPRFTGIYLELQYKILMKYDNYQLFVERLSAKAFKKS